MAEPTIHALLKHARATLRGLSPTPQLDAELLLAQALAQTRTYLYTWPERTPDAAAREVFARLLARRRRGEPVAYLIGRRAFWSLDIQVTPDTLIPRPESELLVDLALAHCATHRTPRVADLGTGSGALALALAQDCPQAEIIAVDYYLAPLQVAQANAQRLGLTQIVFICSDWCTALAAQQFDGIVTNPPYIAAHSPYVHQGDVRFEPVTALVAGPDGLAAIRQVIAQTPRVLKPGGYLWLEHGFDQANAVSALLHHYGFSAIHSHYDANGHPRVASACWA